MNAQELGRLAAAERMIPDAPVQAARTVTVHAPIATVWDVLTDVPRWEGWYPYLRGATLDGPFDAGAALTYGGLFKHHLTIAKVQLRELVMLYGTLVGYPGITKWELKATPGGCAVTFTESSAGFLIGPLYGSARLGEHLERWLEKLKARAEVR